ncbi:MAG: DUF1080 domain-containing protein [Planctomyces sp.]|nr:DUF1080 domain-containing protein [Planctomyces sp.]
MFQRLLTLPCSMMVCTFLSALLSADILKSADRLSWPCRTGPTLNGHVSPEDARGLPSEWDAESGKNIAWKLPLEHFGHSVPVVGNGKIWLTAATKDGKQQFIYCIAASSGEVLHHRLLFENPEPEALKNEVNTYASPSCVVEDDAIYVHFGSYGTARLNPETAETIWERRDIKCRHFRGPGSSPIMFGNLLILTFDGIDAQFLTALDKVTGKTVWRTERTTDYGDLDENGQPTLEGDLRKAYSTPGLVTVNGRTQVVSVGSRAAFSYDALTGEELWTIRHDDFNAAAPPSFLGNLAILNTGSRGANLLAVRLEESTRGDVSESHVVWNRDKGNSDLSSPILIGDRIFMMANNGVVTCVNATNGEEVWKDRIEGTFTASPISANGLIYFCNEEGVCSVIRAADTFETVATNRLPEGMRASPSAAEGMLFLRTFSTLYAIGSKDNAGSNASKQEYPKGEWVSLFNGKDLTGWTPKIRYSELGENYGNTFRVEDGLLKVRYDGGGYDEYNERFGHLFFRDSFSHYRFRVEYRFVGEQCPGGPGWALRNSGVMVHGQDPATMSKDQDFPVSIEVQLLGGNGKDPRTTSNLCTPGTNVVMDGQIKLQHCINSKSKTYHGDQWVTAEIEVRGNEVIRHLLDGEVVLEYNQPQLDSRDASAKSLIRDGQIQLSSGSISLQSESHPIDFRKVEIMVLPEN